MLSITGDELNTDGDKTVKEWKSILVEEDPIYCSEHRADVEDFINLIK